MNQEFSSKNTSINANRTPKVFSLISEMQYWKKNSVNLDIGGGKFNNVQEYFTLNNFNVKNLIYDPFNRSKEHNNKVFELLAHNAADTVTISNVLNVIKEDANKEELINLAYKHLAPNGLLFISIYQGDRTGIGSQTGKDQWQENKKTLEYLPMIKNKFCSVKTKKGIIICKK